MLDVLIYGAVTSAVYAMLAVGFTLVFGVARVLNLAHGAYFGLGAYAVYTLTKIVGWPLVTASVAAVMLVGIFGAAMDYVLVRPMRHSQLGVLIVTLAVALLFEQGVYLVFGSQSRNVAAFSDQTFEIGNVAIAGQRLVTVAAAVVLIGALWLLVQRTKLGSAILAIAQDREGALYMGIPVDRIYAIVMGLSAGLAAAAGILTAPFFAVNPGMYLLPMVKAFSVVIVGGLGSVPGSILAALILGYSETFVSYAVSPAWTEIVSLIAVLLTLIFRPAGLLGRRAAF